MFKYYVSSTSTVIASITKLQGLGKLQALVMLALVKSILCFNTYNLTIPSLDIGEAKPRYNKHYKYFSLIRYYGDQLLFHV